MSVAAPVTGCHYAVAGECVWGFHVGDYVDVMRDVVRT